jgi:hypothetical protein
VYDFIENNEDLLWWIIHCRYSWTHQNFRKFEVLTVKVSGVHKTLVL